MRKDIETYLMTRLMAETGLSGRDTHLTAMSLSIARRACSRKSDEDDFLQGRNALFGSVHSISDRSRLPLSRR